MGYVAAFKKQDYSTPAAIVITETAVDVLIFPFVDPGGGGAPPYCSSCFS